MFTEIPLSVLSDKGLQDLLKLLKAHDSHRFMGGKGNALIEKNITDIELEFIRRGDQIAKGAHY